MTPQGCLVLFVSALYLACSAASDDDFQPGYVSAELFRRGRRLRVVVNYTTASDHDVKGSLFYKGELVSARLKKSRPNEPQSVRFEIPTREQASINITFTLPRTTYTLNLLLPPTEDRTEAIPHVHFEPKGDIVYPESGDVSVNVTVPAGVGREAVSEETLSYTSYVRKGSFFYVSEDWPITVTEQPASGSGAVYRLDFNTSELRPEGVLLLKAYKAYREQGSGLQMVRAVGVEQRVDFYQQNHARPVTPDTLALVRLWSDTMGLSVQQCDLSLTPTCFASCAAIGPLVSTVNMMELGIWSEPSMAGSETSSKMGFLTVTSAPVPDARWASDVRLGCKAWIGDKDGRNDRVEQVIELKTHASPEILRNVSSAVLHPNQTLEVKCRARGLPVPEVIISAAEDPGNTPLAERFPNESFLRVIEVNRDIGVQYWLSKPSFTSSLSQVRCSADNGFKEPAVVVLDVTPA